jgi:acyl-CoA thioester hydrolase
MPDQGEEKPEIILFIAKNEFHSNGHADDMDGEGPLSRVFICREHPWNSLPPSVTGKKRRLVVGYSPKQVTFENSMSPLVSTSVRLTVPYYDVDLMQVVWNGNYLKYFEVARQALFRECGLDLGRYLEEKRYVFPVIRSSIKHIHPLRLNDEFTCAATVREARVKIVLDFEVKRISDGKVCARGRSEQVALLLPEMEMAFKIPVEIENALNGQRNLKG